MFMRIIQGPGGGTLAAALSQHVTAPTLIRQMNNPSCVMLFSFFIVIRRV